MLGFAWLVLHLQTPDGGALVTVTCSSAGQMLSVSGFQGSLTCPDPDVVCAERQKFSEANGCVLNAMKYLRLPHHHHHHNTRTYTHTCTHNTNVHT
jgi:hypothetical protein